ncbi:ankyrin repeat-containing protein [Aspergillus eucalypticola CBS 122712]|uniref:Ankyrin repeat-containing protein n=1 Tax=Aspergillus eucalypticola (strain CBS 122712 / IBT 29274) TaxID=1448314 RepID=A0A317UVQ3_ASPEC|nr:ankyrin repeat-containing protein [Aspergillus eucalypticola CBS 122712]PWY64552.1 ankyrin repeat-containing protein [Aspergillus eucalypticola CBS 122712]
MHLTHLPNETILTIVSFLRRQRDIYALVRTNRRFYCLLRDVLYDYNSRYFHASALKSVAESGDLYLAGRLLDGLKAAVGKPRRQAPSERDWEWLFREGRIDPNHEYDCDFIDPEDSVDSGDENMIHLFSWADIARHPLRAARYSTKDILMVQNALLASIRAGQKDMVVLLLDRGAQPNFYRGPRRIAKYISGWHMLPEIPPPPVPPLFLAVQCGNEKLVEILLDRGAEPDRYHPSPLYRAVADGRQDIVLMLMQGGATDCDSSMKLAAQRGDRSMMEFLLRHGARADLCGAAAYQVALSKGHRYIASLLNSRGAPVYYPWELRVESDKVEGDGTKPELKLYHSSFARDLPEWFMAD